jgi:hypothetical protein
MSLIGRGPQAPGGRIGGLGCAAPLERGREGRLGGAGRRCGRIRRAGRSFSSTGPYRSTNAIFALYQFMKRLMDRLIVR